MVNKFSKKKKRKKNEMANKHVLVYFFNKKIRNKKQKKNATKRSLKCPVHILNRSGYFERMILVQGKFSTWTVQLVEPAYRLFVFICKKWNQLMHVFFWNVKKQHQFSGLHLQEHPQDCQKLHQEDTFWWSPLKIRLAIWNIKFSVAEETTIKFYSGFNMVMTSYIRDSSNFPRRKLDSKMFKA